MPSTPSDWIDVRILSCPAASEFLGLLDDPDVGGVWEDGESLHLYWPTLRWSSERLDRVRLTLRRLRGEEQLLPEIRIDSLPHQDWNRQWAESVKPLRIGRRIVIRPSWEAAEVQADHVEIVLDPKQAFGTGHHATTRMLLEWLETLALDGATVLDVGTGSGILAMVALRLGAVRAVGFDDDPVAVECAQDYARDNRFGEELTLGCGTLARGERFDLVLANLDAATLTSLTDELAVATGRRLLVSGLLVDQRGEIAEGFARAGLYQGGVRELDGWTAVEFLRADACDGPES
ncbi:50S ribosomal protein L11 methyltransferase [Nitrospira japonica]|nr:50S ribosomal protein L11 methyltransferase [Nitrospira japonica]